MTTMNYCHEGAINNFFVIQFVQIFNIYFFQCVVAIQMFLTGTEEDQRKKEGNKRRLPVGTVDSSQLRHPLQVCACPPDSLAASICL